MKLSQFAEHIKKEADVRGYANDRSRADDPLIQPFAALQEQRERLLDLQRSTLSSCWIRNRLGLEQEGSAVWFAGIKALDKLSYY